MISPPLHSILIIGVQQGQTALQCLVVRGSDGAVEA